MRADRESWSVFGVRVVLMLTHNLSASVIEVEHRGRLSLERLAFCCAKLEGANRQKELRGRNHPNTFSEQSLCLETKADDTLMTNSVKPNRGGVWSHQTEEEDQMQITTFAK